MGDIVVKPARYVTLSMAEVVTGYSARALESKIQRGDWAEEREYVRAPDGRILVDIVGYEKWAAGRSSNMGAESKSPSPSAGKRAAPP